MHFGCMASIRTVRLPPKVWDNPSVTLEFCSTVVAQGQVPVFSTDQGVEGILHVYGVTPSSELRAYVRLSGESQTYNPSIADPN